MYDLVLNGGTVVDPSTGLDGPLDVGVQGTTIAHIAPQISSAEATRTIEVAGKIVTPGLIDLHAHVFDRGDILTHYFTANPGGVLDANGKASGSIPPTDG